MKHSLLAFLFVLTSLGLNAQHPEPEYVDGNVLVQLMPDAKVESIVETIHERFGSDLRMRATREIVPDMRIWLLEYDHRNRNQRAILDAVIFHPATLNAQFNHLVTNRATVPNDPNFGQQWQYVNNGNNGNVVDADIDADLAWDITTGGLTPLGDTIVVCVIDDGLNPNHQDFQDNVWINYGEIPNNNIDDDGNGFVDDYRGWDAYGNDDNIYSGGGHGTPVAGIVGAKGNNGIGVTGVNWDVKLMIVRGGGNEAQALAAYAYPLAVRKQWNQTGGQSGALVVSTNASWGIDFGQPSQAPLWCAMYDTLGTYGILNCGATINNNTNVDVAGDLPTACPSDYLISVTNMNSSDNKINSAGYGAVTIDLGAPGQGTHTPQTPNSYGPFGGTSGATPHVTGTIGLLYSAPCTNFAVLALTKPDSAALLMKQFILDGVDANNSLQGITVTEGRLNVYNSLLEMLNWSCSFGGCIEAYGLDVNNVIDTSATLAWNAVSSADSFVIEIRPVGAANWTSYQDTSRSLTLNNLQACTDYEYRVLTYCDSTNANYSNVYAFQTDGCCVSPDSVQTAAITETTADVSFASIYAAVTYNLRYRELGTSAWTTVSGLSAPTTQLQGLDSCTVYEIAVQTVCDTGATIYSPATTFQTTGCLGCRVNYCLIGGDDATEEWIDSVTVGTMVNGSGNDNGYGDFTNSSFTLTLMQSQGYNFRLVPGYSNSVFDEYFRIWIDLNNDGDFGDALEKVYDSGAGVNAAVTGSFIMPASGMVGTTRMRVAMRYLSAPDACGPNFDFGEVEDYCVEVVPFTVSTEEPQTRPTTVYPNPFQDQLNVEFEMSTPGPIQITLYDLFGKAVARFDREVLNAGMHRETLSAQGLAEGVYLLRLITQDQQETIKVNLMKE